ncbi:hypothetical protein [Paenibacillus illinoisensis]|uniref:hypothetical protein n=1 Tax=Paenibacillus illinoisensis TaxID=59845 RepID=UPI00203A4875|nr:hypothetical protein [Paenibacillus illinoisensis]MCM3203133.1 hypothetical protein [Paenibacillus illinoisensis]
MNLFHIQSTLHGTDRTAAFLKDNFIGIDWPATGDLEQLSAEEWKEQIGQHYTIPESELSGVLDTLQTFVKIMQDGDHVIVHDDEWVYVGDVGDYFYDDSVSIEEDSICHRRGVTWLGRIPLTEINNKVRALISNASIISTFEYPLSQAQLEPWISRTSETETAVQHSVGVDDGTEQEALDVLRKALQSEDEELRIRAATAILQYAKK